MCYKASEESQPRKSHLSLDMLESMLHYPLLL